MTATARRRTRVALWVAAAVVACAVVFAPVFTVGYCADSPVADRSFCDISQRSVLGAETSLWLWLGVTVVAAAITGMLAASAPTRSSR